MLRHVRIKDDLHLINQTIEHKKQTVKETVLNTHHIFIKRSGKPIHRFYVDGM